MLLTGLLSVSVVGRSAAQTTPIEHVVVIFQENQSFDHYFGTYPVATNPPGEPVLFRRPDPRCERPEWCPPNQ